MRGLLGEYEQKNAIRETCHLRLQSPISPKYSLYTRVRYKKIFRKVPIALISLRVPAVPPAYCQRNNRL